LIKGLFVLGLPLGERFSGGKRKRGRLHLLKAPESGELGWFGAMVLFLAHERRGITYKLQNFRKILKFGVYALGCAGIF